MNMYCKSITCLLRSVLAGTRIVRLAFYFIFYKLFERSVSLNELNVPSFNVLQTFGYFSKQN